MRKRKSRKPAHSDEPTYQTVPSRALALGWLLERKTKAVSWILKATAEERSEGRQACVRPPALGVPFLPGSGRDHYGGTLLSPAFPLSSTPRSRDRPPRTRAHLKPAARRVCPVPSHQARLQSLRVGVSLALSHDAMR